MPNLSRLRLGLCGRAQLPADDVLQPGRDPSTKGRTTTPSSAELATAIEEHAELISDFDQVRAILVARGDEIVHEQYFGTDADAYWGIQSVTKSVVSTLVGIALDEGLIASVDDTLAELLPRHVDVMSPACRPRRCASS